MSLLEQELGAHRVVLMVCGRQVERTVFAEWPNVFWIAVLAILEDGGHRLARCLRPECCRVFVRIRRQQYCSPRCSQIMRSRRWYAAHRPEARSRRRQAYQAQVKTVYPRAKVATRTRRARLGLIRFRGHVPKGGYDVLSRHRPSMPRCDNPGLEACHRTKEQSRTWLRP